MISVWLVTVFNVYLLGFVVVEFDDGILSTFAASAADLSASAVAGVLFAYIGLKLNYMMAFSIAIIGSS